MNSTSKFVLSLLGAAAAGAVIALLVTPVKGSELRSKIQSTAGDWTEKLSDLVSSSKQKIGEMRSKAEKGLADVQQIL